MPIELVRTYIERNISGSWSDISSYVVGDLSYEYLIPENSADEMLASVGELELVMNNGDGSFSPSPTFHRGTPIRVRTVYDGISKTRFLGTILDMDADTLDWGDQYVRVTVVDWLNFAVDHPMIIPQLMENSTVDDAVAYLLTLMSVQPESVTYKGSRETLDFIFDTIKEETKAYSELNKLALSEFAPIYLRGGNNLVIESADTRAGTRDLTQIPVNPSNSAALLTSDGYVLLTADGVPLLVSQLFTPNMATGTIQPMDIEIDEEAALSNRVKITAYPSRTDASPVKLFQLDHATTFGTFQTKTINGTWANPDGGLPINADSITHPIITGTNYIFTDKDNTLDWSTQLMVVNEQYGTHDFAITFFNSGTFGVLRQLDLYGIGRYPYNPNYTIVMVTGSVNTYGISELSFDQKYQDNPDVSLEIARKISDDEREPSNRVESITFDASSSSQLMQASQYMDVGDLTWVRNNKPAVDTYAYIRGKKVTITTAGVVTETWYLKEMDSLKKGLNMIALRSPSGGSLVSATKTGVNFGVAPRLSNLSQKSITAWIRTLSNGPVTAPILSKYDGTNGWYFFVLGPAGQLHYRENFTPTDGQWKTNEGQLTGSFVGVWSHIAMTYDNSDTFNIPTFYFNGAAQTTLVTGSNTSTPAGIVDTDEDGLLILENVSFPGFDYFYNPGWEIKDVRLYERILTPSEIAEIASNANNYLTVQGNLVFQVPCVKTEDYGNLTGTILYTTNKIIDNVYGIRGTPNWNFPSGTSFGIRAISPLS